MAVHELTLYVIIAKAYAVQSLLKNVLLDQADDSVLRSLVHLLYTTDSLHSTLVSTNLNHLHSTLGCVAQTAAEWLRYRASNN